VSRNAVKIITRLMSIIVRFHAQMVGSKICLNVEDVMLKNANTVNMTADAQNVLMERYAS